MDVYVYTNVCVYVHRKDMLILKMSLSLLQHMQEYL